MFMGGWIKNGVPGQARFEEVSPKFNIITKNTVMPYNPAVLFMAVAMVSIDKKLTEIHETSKNILTFLEDDKHSKLMGNYVFLESVVNDYRFNLGDSTYKDNAHVKVLDIRQESEQNIIFYQETLQRKLSKKAFLANNAQIKGQIKEMLSAFEDYRTALFLFGYSSFVEVMLLENFRKDYIDAVVEKIEERSRKYSEYYTICREKIEKISKGALEANVIGAVAKVGGSIGKLVAKTPLIKDTQLDENLIASEGKLSEYKDKWVDSVVDKLSGAESDVTSGFVDNLQTINRLYNDDLQLYFDDENLYLA